jgi:hypothetical protein
VITIHNASIAYVDEDHSELSRRIIRAFLPPYFHPPQPIAERDIIPLMNAGRYTFIVDIPCSSCELLCAWAMTTIENAQIVSPTKTQSRRKLRISLVPSQKMLLIARILAGS